MCTFYSENVREKENLGGPSVCGTDGNWCLINKVTGRQGVA